jgi:hypothetical protein
MLVVLDTNLFVAAYFNPGSASAQIIKLASKGKVQIVWTKKIRNEANLILRNVSVAKKYDELINKLFDGGIYLAKVPACDLVPEDQEDNKFLAVAIAGKADYIITSDRHMLKLGKIGKTKIVKPSQFLRTTIV